MTRSSSSGPSGSALPDWMRWLGAGLTALVAVLFVVLLLQVREQGQKLQTLQTKVQGLENSNDLERTNALEEQLRSTVQRLQSLETIDNAVQQLSREQQALRQQLRSRAAEPAPLPLDSSLSPQPQPARPSLPPLPPGQE
jgi:TolA-binding protein